ncbi:hypothetical protein COLO4_13485 [Corchorus olitorius]|uniref:Uncharacterized protein n=1 Tax=Corchorus olitorius TaxID=93759 RepID=A0A1R3JWB7_9ROSI|nr:hypothetical protein COLO4_13485 [Corchorus olitorius]
MFQQNNNEIYVFTGVVESSLVNLAPPYQI